VKHKVLDLFSGIGGFSLGLEGAGDFETVAFCEIEKYPQKVLARHWPGVPIYEDVRELTAERLRADGIVPTVICGGFPCQDISNAGKGAGIGEGTRSGLWSECARLLGELRPDYAIFENVTALLSGDSGRWFQRVLWDISQVGYDAEWHCIPASELGAHHHRDRVWIIAYPRLSESQGRNTAPADNDRRSKAGIQQRCEPASPCSDVSDTTSVKQSGGIDGGESKRSKTTSPEGTERTSGRGGEPNVSDTDSERLQGLFAGGSIQEWSKTNGYSGPGSQPPGWSWGAEPSICGMVDGLPNGIYEGRVTTGTKNRARRLKALGNSVVPQIPELIGRAIMQAQND
jgi:DNA (cytosine-5)-methyltransferase 1